MQWVWFYPNGGKFGWIDLDRPMLALVVYEHRPGLVNLTVFDSGGFPHAMPRVRMLKDGEEPPRYEHYCKEKSDGDYNDQ